MSMKDTYVAVHHPGHYNKGKIEVIEFLEDQRLGFHLANVVKYVTRAGHKSPETIVEDLEKAAWYLQRKIELLKAKRDGRTPRRPNEMDAMITRDPSHPLAFLWLGKKMIPMEVKNKTSKKERK